VDQPKAARNRPRGRSRLLGKSRSRPLGRSRLLGRSRSRRVGRSPLLGRSQSRSLLGRSRLWKAGAPVRLASPVDRVHGSLTAGRSRPCKVGTSGAGSHLLGLPPNLLGQSPLVLLAQMTNDSIAQCLTPTARNATIKSVPCLVVRKSVCQLMKRKYPRVFRCLLFRDFNSCYSHSIISMIWFDLLSQLPRTM
jgi:hypothetical protein